MKKHPISFNWRFLPVAVVITLCVLTGFSQKPNPTLCTPKCTEYDFKHLTLEDSIAVALDYQMSNYPASQYRDIYKNFMQDFFGPGHILADTTASGRYLRYELAETDVFDGPLYEKTGYKGNFYRVNILLIRDGIIPYDAFFKNFVESVQRIQPPSSEEWMETWALIDEVIRKKGLSFPDEETDRAELAQQFANQDYVVHHSQRYNDSVHFHYRIISKDLFEQNLLPFLIPKGMSD